jgi:hypothetical protein
MGGSKNPSSNGPIASVSNSTGRKGNVIAAMASETGKFRADVVNIRGILSLKASFTTLPVKNVRRKTAIRGAVIL